MPADFRLQMSLDQGSLRRLAQKLSPAKLAGAMHSGMEESVAWIKHRVVEETPVDRGFLRAGITTDIHGVGVGLTGTVFPSPAVAQYASVVEWGRRPGRKMPPIQVIAEWARRKGITTPAFVIARSIGRKGIPGKHMFEKAFKASKAPVQRIFERHFKRWAA